jgi:hypothetical protein
VREAEGFSFRAARLGTGAIRMRTRRFFAAIGCVAIFSSGAFALDTAVSVASYMPGDFTNSPQFKPYQTASTATGPLAGDTTFGGLTPFNPPFDPSQITGIGAGGELTLQMASPVPTSGKTLGVFSNAGLNDASSDGSGVAGSPAQTLDEAFGETDPQASVAVSQDGKMFFNLNGGNPISFLNPTNYYLDESIANFSEPLGTQIADQSKPFTGSLSDFNGLDFDQIKTLLAGSAGGTWLDLSGVPLSSINFVQFTVPVGATFGMAVDSVSAVPEPILVLPLLIGTMLLRRRVYCKK